MMYIIPTLENENFKHCQLEGMPVAARPLEKVAELAALNIIRCVCTRCAQL